MKSLDNSLDFSDYIDERTRGFTGREWVFKAIDLWLKQPAGSSCFLLTGEPGSGKSAIAARLAQVSDVLVPKIPKCESIKPGFLSAVHFCSARERQWINPHRFSESLALQLAARYPAYASALAEKSSDEKIHIKGGSKSV
jgi:predicted ATPase